MSDGILHQLRLGTGSAHAQLEAQVQIEKKLADTASYLGLIKKFFGWYQPMEQRLAGLESHPHWPHTGYELAGRRKTPWLQQDLLALGLSNDEIRDLPVCQDLPAIDTPAQALGCAYVMEGATLGGRHISSMMRDSAVPAHARHFFSSYGPEVGSRWKEFIAGLESFASLHSEEPVIVASAEKSFASMAKWLDEA